MAIVKPFKGLRYSEMAGNIEKLVCPPYDIISEDRRKALLSTNPYNMIRLELPREGEDVYYKAADTLEKWLEQGIVATDQTENFYIYSEAFEVEGKSYSLKGIIGRVKLTNFDEGVVIPHENTLSAAKEDRFKLMCATGCNFSQVYCLFKDNDRKITEQMDSASEGEPVQRFTDNEGVTHSLWKTQDTEQISRFFEGKCLYIADGHHRYETGLRYRDEMRKNGASDDADSEYIMMMLVPMECDGLVVFPTHRIVHSVDGFDPHHLLADCSEYFHTEPAPSAEVLEKKLKSEYEESDISFGLCVDGKYYLLTLKDKSCLAKLLSDVDPTLRNLDVTVLHSLILEKILGIDKENLAKQKNLKYTRDVAEAVSAVEGGANCAFLLNPTRISQIAAVGDAGQKMPQKSTYFYPKLITGLVMNKMD